MFTMLTFQANVHKEIGQNAQKAIFLGDYILFIIHNKIPFKNFPLSNRSQVRPITTAEKGHSGYLQSTFLLGGGGGTCIPPSVILILIT